MPLPWRKTKVKRISRIVADLQSPKRGGSLVVETGFPTSLIDLFVKNRDRLRKPSLKKKKKKKSHQNDMNQLDNVNDDLLTSDSITKVSHSGLDDWSLRDEPICEEVENSAPSESVQEEEEETKVESETHEDQNCVVVFLAVLKIFSVVVLALSTKKLTVGITLSAFVLLFLECVCVGKRLSFRFLQLFRFKTEEGELVEKNRSRSSIEEIEVLEAKNSNNEEVFRGPDLELLSKDKKWGFLDKKEATEDRKAEVLVLEKSKSNSKTARIRAKIIKNIVPKKLRSTKKDKKLKYSQDEDNKVGSFEEKEEDQGREEEEEEKEQKEEIFDKVDDGNQVSVASDEQEEEEEGRREEAKWNWVCLTLFVIVLVGLFGGRILALLLAIAWCLVLKLVGRQRRSSFVI